MVLVLVLSLALVAGCDSGSKNSATTGMQATTPAASGPGGAPLSKAQYETKLVGALRPAQTAGSLANRITSTSSADSDARVFDQVAGIYQRAYDDIKPIVPPTQVADLHAQVVAALGALAQDATRARDALRSRSKATYRAALRDFKAQGQKLQSLGQQLTARGY
jgi:hypothetical protein